MEEKKKRIQIGDLSLFWRYLLMMCCFILLLCILFLVYRKQVEEILVDKNLAQAEERIQSRAKTFSKQLGSASEIPFLLENTSIYYAFEKQKEGSLPPAYTYAAMRLRDILIKQATYVGEFEEAAFAVPWLNTVISKRFSVKTIDTYLNESLRFEDIGPDWIREKFTAGEQTWILPAQKTVFSNSRLESSCILMLVGSSTKKSCLLLVMSRDQLLKELGFGLLPEGSYIRLRGNSSSVIAESDRRPEFDRQEEYYIFHADLNELRLQEEIWIPKAYFRSLMAPYLNRIARLCGVFILISGVMSFLFSSMSVKPLKKLTSELNIGEGGSRNELRVLENYLSDSDQERSALKNSLIQSQINRLFSGGVLHDDEIRHLEQDLGTVNGYRLALLVCGRSGEKQLEIIEEFRRYMPDIRAAAITDRKEFGLVLPDREDTVEKLRNVFDLLKIQNGRQFGLQKGAVSDSYSDLNDFHVALRHARTAIPPSRGFEEYNSDQLGAGSDSRLVSWVIHEKLYQAILNNNEEEASEIIQKAAENTQEDFASLQFYNMQYVLICSASESGIDLSGLGTEEYDGTVSVSDNFRRLEKKLRKVFGFLSEKKKKAEDVGKGQILQYIRNHYQDCNLTALLASEQLNIKEITVHDAVREATGSTFNEYLTSLRMQKVIELMGKEELSTLEIAQQCGFYAESTFYRLFKQKYSTTPAKYRRDLMREQKYQDAVMSDAGKKNSQDSRIIEKT